MPDEREQGPPPSTIDRLSLVLNCFESSPRLTLIDVSRRTGIPRTSTYRMLDHLVRIRWLQRWGLEYGFGERLADIGAVALYQNRFDRIVPPLLHELHALTGHTVHLGALDGRHVRYLDRVGNSDSPGPSMQVGDRILARSSTIGRALLANAVAPESARCPTYSHARRPKVTLGKCVNGLTCVGVRVGSLEGVEVGLSISGPTRRAHPDLQYAPAVQMAAAAIASCFALSVGSSAHLNQRSHPRTFRSSDEEIAPSLGH